MTLKINGTRQAGRIPTVLAVGFLISVLGSGDAQAQTRTERFFDDWRVVCVERDESPRQCSMTQTLVQNNPRRQVFRWLVGVNQEGEMVDILNAPLGVLLGPGMEVSVEGEDPVTVAYNVCGRRWCQGPLPTSDEVRGRMTAGVPVHVVYSNARGQRLRMEVTVRGYREALNYLRSQIGK